MLKTKNFISLFIILNCMAISSAFAVELAGDIPAESADDSSLGSSNQGGGGSGGNKNEMNLTAINYCIKGVGNYKEKGRGLTGGSDALFRCNELSNGRLPKFSSAEQFKKFDWAASSIATICKEKCEDFKKAVDSNEGKAALENGKLSKNSLTKEPINSVAKSLSSCVNDELDYALSCGAALHIISANGKSFSKAEDMKVAEGGSGNSQPSVIIANQNGLSMGANESISCVSKGIETIDYKPCKEFNEMAQTLEVAHEAVKTGQNLYYQNKAIDTAYEASKNSPNDATAGLKAQKSSFKDMQENFTQNSAIEASKAAYLLTKYNSMPDDAALASQCSSFESTYFSNSKLQKQYSGAGANQRCNDIVTNPNYGFAFLMNQQARDGMKKKMAMLGVKAVAEGANAYMASQRADQLSDAIANVESFKPVTAPGLEQAVDATFCQMNPGAAKCKTNLNSQFSTIGDNIVDFSNNGTGTVYSGSNDTTTNSNGSSPTTSGTTTAAKSGPIGSAITGVNNGSGLESTAAAATISKGNGPTGGGGGGGGGGSAGGGGGGGGAASGAAGAQQAVAGSSGKMPLYSGGGGGVSIMGGLGIKNGKKTADSSVNPFANLMGKDKASPDKVLNFGGRSPASVGTKGDNLFDMISKRYGTVNNDKRLLEYEEVK